MIEEFVFIFLIKYLVDLRKIDIVKAMTVISAITKV